MSEKVVEENTQEQHNQNEDNEEAAPKVEELNSDDEGSFHSCEEPTIQQEKNETKEKLTNEFAKEVEEDEKTQKEEIKVQKDYVDIKKAEECKAKGNEMFKAQEYIEALDFYKKAIYFCPDESQEQKAIYYNNKGMVLVKLDKTEEALEAFEESIKQNETYLKPRYQKMKILKSQEKYTDAKDEAKIIIEKDPHFAQIQYELADIEKLEKEKLDKMKDEVMGNLKTMGNSILGKFGMSLDQFKFNQNPDGTYNLSMNQ